MAAIPSPFHVHLDNEDAAKSVSIRSVEDGPLKWVYAALTSTLEIAKNVPHHHHAGQELADRCIALLDLVKGVVDGSFGDGSTTHKLSQHLLRYQVEFEDLAKYMAKQKKRGWFSSSILHRSSIERKVEARSRRLEEIRMGFVWLQGVDHNHHHHHYETEKPSTVLDSPLTSRHRKFDHLDDSFDSSFSDESIHSHDRGHNDIGYLENTSNDKIVVSPNAPAPTPPSDIVIESPRIKDEFGGVANNIPAEQEADKVSSLPVYHDGLSSNNSNSDPASLDGWTSPDNRHGGLKSLGSEAIVGVVDQARPVSDPLDEAGPQAEVEPSLGIESDEARLVSDIFPAQDGVDPTDALAHPISELPPIFDDDIPQTPAEPNSSSSLEESRDFSDLLESNQDPLDSAPSPPAAAESQAPDHHEVSQESISHPQSSDFPEHQTHFTEDIDQRDVPDAILAGVSVNDSVVDGTTGNVEARQILECTDDATAIGPIADISISVPTMEAGETQITAPTTSPSPETGSDAPLVVPALDVNPLDQKDDAQHHEPKLLDGVEGDHESTDLSNMLPRATEGNANADILPTGVAPIESDVFELGVDDSAGVFPAEYSTGSEESHPLVLDSMGKDGEEKAVQAHTDAPHMGVVGASLEPAVEDVYQADDTLALPRATSDDASGLPIETEAEGNGMNSNDLELGHDWEHIQAENVPNTQPSMEEPREVDAVSPAVDEPVSLLQTPTHLSHIQSTLHETFTADAPPAHPPYPEPVDCTPSASNIPLSPPTALVGNPSLELAPLPISLRDISFSSPTPTTFEPISDTSATASLVSGSDTPCSSPDAPTLDSDLDTVARKRDHALMPMNVHRESQEPSPLHAHLHPQPQPDESSEFWKRMRRLMRTGTTFLPHGLFLLSVYLTLDQEFVIIL